MSETPDEVVWHEPEICNSCQRSLQDEPVVSYQKRQVVDLPPPKLLFIEHRAVSKCCPNCGDSQTAPFPEHVKAPVQYGESWSAWTAYLHTYQLLPLDRVSQLYGDVTGHRPSEATLLSHLDKLSEKLEPVELEVKQALRQDPVVHADETGMRVEGRLHWLHVVSNEQWTFYAVHPKRGREAVNEIGLLSSYRGTVIHDCWATYFNKDYEFSHGLFGVHLLRECQGIIDYDHHKWASEMQALLLEALQEKKKGIHSEKPIPPKVLAEIEARYDAIPLRGKAEWHQPPDPGQPVKRGRKKKSKAENLAERFILYKEGILRFLRDGLVPFDNSQAERDIRMMKVKEKISGSFRTRNGAGQFVRIRGFISSVRKQGRDLLSSLGLAVTGQFSFDQPK